MSSLSESLARALIANREAFTTAIVESCPVPMFAADMQGDWIHVNLNYQRFLLRRLEDVCGNGWKNTVHPEDRAVLLAQWDHIVARRLNARHILFRHTRPGLMGPIAGYLSVGCVPGSGFIGWFAPVCAKPVECPFHEHLLRNIVVSSGTSVSAKPDLTSGL